MAPRSNPGKPTAPRGGADAAATDALAFQALTEIGIISQLAGARLEAVLPHGMPMAQFHVLNHFARLGGERPLARLAEAFQVTKGAMTNTVGRLLERGFVAVRAHPVDGRVKLVSITARGLRARHDAITALAPELVRIEAAVGADALAALLPGLQRMRQWLDEDRSQP